MDVLAAGPLPLNCKLHYKPWGPWEPWRGCGGLGPSLWGADWVRPGSLSPAGWMAGRNRPESPKAAHDRQRLSRWPPDGLCPGPTKVLGAQLLLAIPLLAWRLLGRGQCQVPLWSPGPGSWGGMGRGVCWGWLSPSPQKERSHVLGVLSGFWNHVATGDISHNTVGLGVLARGWDGSFPASPLPPPGSLVGWGRHPGRGTGCHHPLRVPREETLLQAGGSKEPVIGRPFCPRDGGCWPHLHRRAPWPLPPSATTCGHRASSQLFLL